MGGGEGFFVFHGGWAEEVRSRVRLVPGLWVLPLLGSTRNQGRRAKLTSPNGGFVLQANLNDSHNQMVVHWAGEKSNVIVALARDSTGSPGPKTSSVKAPPWFCWTQVLPVWVRMLNQLPALPVQVYVSYDYGTTFTDVSDKFQLPGPKADEEDVPIISQFYHSPADNKRVGTSSSLTSSSSRC